MKLDPADRSQSAGGLLSKQRPVSLILSKKSVSSSQYSTNGQQYDAHRREQSTHLTTTTTATIVKVTSQDSIGNCSLNVHAAAGETGDGGQNTRDNLMTASASTRDLKSVSMEPDIANSSSSSSSRRQQWPAGMMSGAHVIAPGSGPHQSGSIRRRIGSIEILDNRPPVGTQQFDSHPGLKPSYVHLACAVSGYSDINRYNSKLRDGFRSRDSSPVKIAWLRNSPMTSPKSTSTGSGTSTFIPGDENGQHAPLQRLKSPTLVVVSGGNDSPLSPRTPSGLRSPLKVLEIQQQQEKLLRGGYGATTFGSGRSVSVDRARFFDSPSVMTKVSPGFYTESLSSNRKSGSWARTENEYLDTEKERQSRSSRRAMNGSGPTTPSRAAGVGNGDAGRQVGQEDKEYAEAISSGKSFIQQRIERLYGQQRRKSDAEDDVDAAVLANVKKREEKREEEEKEKEKEEEKKKNKTKMLLGAAPAPGTVPAVAKAVEKHGGPPEAPGTPPVFRHLRQEFREQLPLAKKLGGKKKLQQQQHQPSRAVSSVSLTLARPDLETKGARAEANAGAAKSAAEEDEASVSLSTASSSSNNNKNNNNNSSSTTAGGSVSVHLSTDHEKEAEAAGAIASTPALSSPTAADDAVEEGRKGVEPVSTRSPSPTTDAVVSEIDNDDDVSSATDSYSYPIVKDGNYYVKVMDDERERLTGFIVPAEDEVALGKLPEEASGILRATTGKARLLLDQKFAQFKSLCDKNLIPGGEGETKVTNEDLAGFWDMVSIQVEQINEMFKDIEDLRKNGWTVVEKPNIVAKSAKRPSNSKKRSGPSPTPSKTPSPANAPPSAATRRADERRKQLLEAKRRMKREFEGKQQQQEQEQQGHDNDDGEGNGRTSPNSEL